MSASDSDNPQPADVRDQRLRADPVKVGLARLRLAATERAVFSTVKKHGAGEHDRLLRQLVGELFGHG